VPSGQDRMREQDSNSDEPVNVGTVSLRLVLLGAIMGALHYALFPRPVVGVAGSACLGALAGALCEILLARGVNPLNAAVGWALAGAAACALAAGIQEGILAAAAGAFIGAVVGAPAGLMLGTAVWAGQQLFRPKEK